MNAFALHAPTDHAGFRWTFSAVVILAIHAGLIAGGIVWYAQQSPAGSQMPVIMIDMAPAAAAPETSQQDAAPGPEMEKSEELAQPPEEPMQQAVVEEQIPPAPVMEKPEVEAPPEQKPEPVPPPEPAKITPEPPMPKPEVVPPKRKPVRAEVKKKPSETPYAPRTSAAPRADRQGAVASTPATGFSGAASASYNQLVTRHLMGVKQYPSSARAANQEGRAVVFFTLDRNGRVLASRLASSSGHSALDAEVVAMVRRAQPFPPFPPDKKGSSDSFTAPIGFFLR